MFHAAGQNKEVSGLSFCQKNASIFFSGLTSSDLKNNDKATKIAHH